MSSWDEVANILDLQKQTWYKMKGKRKFERCWKCGSVLTVKQRGLYCSRCHQYRRWYNPNRVSLFGLPKKKME